MACYCFLACYCFFWPAAAICLAGCCFLAGSRYGGGGGVGLRDHKGFHAEKSAAKNPTGTEFCFFEVKYWILLKVAFFFFSQYLFRVRKHDVLGNKIYGTLGDALSYYLLGTNIRVPI
jgi:hypothetical protein